MRRCALSGVRGGLDVGLAAGAPGAAGSWQQSVCAASRINFPAPAPLVLPAGGARRKRKAAASHPSLRAPETGPATGAEVGAHSDGTGWKKKGRRTWREVRGPGQGPPSSRLRSPAAPPAGGAQPEPSRLAPAHRINPQHRLFRVLHGDCVLINVNESLELTGGREEKKSS